MSRSKHTDPRAIRAARRVRVLDERRGIDDRSGHRRLGKALKTFGVLVSENRYDSTNIRRPRIIVRRARPGYHHPLSKRDILKLLDLVGSVAVYGLRCIELRHSTVTPSCRAQAFGHYQVPGKIVLYEQPLSPWRLPKLAPKTIRQLQAAGATIITLPHAGATLVDWPGKTLHRFMLEQVLLHEIGHHVLQYHKGKRLIRIARSRDHEAFAAQFVRKQQRALREATC